MQTGVVRYLPEKEQNRTNFATEITSKLKVKD